MLILCNNMEIEKMLISPAYAQAAGAAASGSSLAGMAVQLLLIFAIFYLLLIRPQQKRIKEHEARLAAIKRGDRILTGGGIYAKVIEVIETADELKAEIAEGVIVTLARSTVREVLTDAVSPLKPEKIKKEVKKNTPANTNKKSKK